MVKKLLDKGSYPILEFSLIIDDRGRATLSMAGLAKSQEEEVEFHMGVQGHVVKGWPVIKEIPKTQKRGPGRPHKNAGGE